MGATIAPSVEDVVAASAVIGGRLIRTPVLSSDSLGEAIRARVFLKAELLQKTGSFKPRGVLTKLASLTPEEKTRGVISISAGNHAQALAYACALEHLPCLVVMWQGVSEFKVAATRGYGATVDLEASDPSEAFERLAGLESSTGRVLVHPYDEPRVVAGQGTVGLEIAEDRPDVDVVVCPVGGGGLISGITVALAATRPGTRVVAVEPETSAALAAALSAGAPTPLRPVSVADALNAPVAGRIATAVCAEHGVETVLVTEEEIEVGFRFLYARAKLAAEPGGAAAVAALLAGKVADVEGKTVVAVVSGGNVSAQTASAILDRDAR